MLGRYAIDSTKPKIFEQAASFGGSIEGAPATAGVGSGVSPAAAMPAAASMVTVPMQGETIADARPEIKANLATLGALDPKSVEMRVSGFGLVPATYDPASQLLSFKLHQQLHERTVTVLVSGRANGRKVQAGWSFNFDRNFAPAAPETAAPTPADEAGIPPMKPAE